MAEIADKLTPKQHKAIVALMSTTTIGEAAAQADIGERTLYTWLDDADFAEAYRAARREAVGHAVARLQQMSSHAVTVLISLMADKRIAPSVRLAAASRVLDMSIKAVELDDLAARLEALEQAYAEKLKDRLAALEALEAEVEQKRQATAVASPPDIAELDDSAVLFEVVLGLRYGDVDDGLPDEATGEPQRLCLAVAGGLSEPWEAFYAGLVERAQPLIDAYPWPLITLANWEVNDALELIDSGRVDVVPLWIPAVAGLRGTYYRLRLDGEVRTDADGQATIQAVNHAVELWACQQGLPDKGAWEMTELAEWRDWLVGLLQEAV